MILIYLKALENDAVQTHLTSSGIDSGAAVLQATHGQKMTEGQELGCAALRQM